MSTDTALTMTIGKIEAGIRRKKGLAVAVFLDIRGAFDNVNVAFTSNALLDRGFDPSMVAGTHFTSKMEWPQPQFWECQCEGF